MAGKDQMRLLGFKEMAIKAFYFLERDYGYKCVVANDTFIRYECNLTFVNIYHGRTSYEIGFEVGPRNKDHDVDLEERFSLFDLLELAGVREELGYEFYQASTTETMIPIVDKIAEWVKVYGVDALKGDANTFARLTEIQKKLSDNYLENIELRRVIEKATSAWKDRRFADYIKICKPFENKLSPTERNKLEYAKRKIGR